MLARVSIDPCAKRPTESLLCVCDGFGLTHSQPNEPNDVGSRRIEPRALEEETDSGKEHRGDQDYRREGQGPLGGNRSATSR